jgi:hypothetical protein
MKSLPGLITLLPNGERMATLWIHSTTISDREVHVRTQIFIKRTSEMSLEIASGAENEDKADASGDSDT